MMGMKLKRYLENSPIFALNASYEAVIPRLNRQLRSKNLNLLQGLVLTAILFEDQAEVTPSGLATTFRTSRGNMSHIISALEASGYVSRSVSKTDARSFQLELRAEGKRQALVLVKFFNQLQDFFESKLGVTNCEKLVQALNQLALANSEFITKTGKL